MDLLARLAFWNTIGSQFRDTAAVERAKLEIELIKCGNCPGRSRIEEQIKRAKTTVEGFENVAWTVLEVIGAGDPNWVKANATLLGLRPPERFDRLTSAEVIRSLKKEGVREECIDLYKRYDACIAASKAAGVPSGGKCEDANKLFGLCRVGDMVGLAREASVQELRKAGFILPEIKKGPLGYSADYGDVPDSFMPVIPPPDGAGLWRVRIRMNRLKPNLLFRVQLESHTQFIGKYSTDLVMRTIGQSTEFLWKSARS